MKTIRSEFDTRIDPHPISGLRYEELVEMISLISDPNTDEQCQAYYIGFINLTRPDQELQILFFGQIIGSMMTLCFMPN